MAYIGHNASGNFTTKPSKDTFSGDGSTTAFTLSEGATTNTVDVFVENVRQEPTTAYSVNGTTLTFTEAPGSGTNNIYVVNRGPLQLSATHPAAQALEASTGTFTGDLTVDTNTLVVDSTNNRVGIGTTTVDSNAVLGMNGRATFGDQATSGTVGAGSLLIGANALYIQAGENRSSTNAADIRFTNIGGSAERLRIQSGGGISFNGDTAAANALDDYEEGTWTPTAGNGTISFSVAHYTKIGNKVTVTVVLSSFSDRTTAANIQISGLPYATTSDDTAIAGAMHRYVNSGGDQVVTYLGSSRSYISFFSCNQNSNYETVQHNDLSSSDANFFVTITYLTT